MADKYIIHGATFNGDGTTSAEAASAGAAGAWNNINVLTGTAVGYGTLVAGDVVYIRSKSSAGADITLSTSTYTLGLAAATDANRVTWVLDGGTVWSGINGTLSFSGITEWNGITIRAWNNLFAENPEKIQIIAASGNRNVPMLTTNVGSNTRNLYIDVNAVIVTATVSNQETVNASGGLHENIKVRRAALPASRGVFATAYNQYTKGNHAVFVNPTVELTSTNSASTGAVFHSPASTIAAGGGMTVIGGRVHGAGADAGFSSLMSLNGTVGAIKVYGMDYPKNMPSLASINHAHASSGAECSVVGADKGYGSFFGWPAVGEFDSRNLLYNYPTLDAVAPDSVATPWSWRGVPKTTLVVDDPMVLKIGTFYSSATAAKTLTLEMLVSDTVTSLDSYNCWMTVMYVDDATGNYVTQTTSPTFGAGATLNSSSAAWSAVVWGAINLEKRKLALTTTGSIRQNTMVFATLFWGRASATATDIFFACPAVQLT